MKRVMLPSVIALIVPLLLLSFIGGFPGKASEEQQEEEITQLIETASTPEDHMKIAGFYEKEAAKMEEKALTHTSMADAYKLRSKPLPGMAKHCTNLSKKYEEAAKEYSDMANEHRKMAQEMKSPQ